MIFTFFFPSSIIVGGPSCSLAKRFVQNDFMPAISFVGGGVSVWVS